MNDSRVRVLLLDDSPSDAALLQEQLGQVSFEQFEVTHFERLEDALGSLANETFQVMLLDLSLPDSSGLETLVRVRSHAADLPLVVLTGANDDALGLEAVRGGAQDYLIKGQADARQIVRSIRYAVERHRMEQAARRSEEALRRAHAELERRVEDRTAELARANQTLQMVSECNQALVRAETEQSLIEEVCQVINRFGGYRMAWVGFAEHDRRKTVRAVASFGFEEGYLEAARISWANTRYGRGPTGTAIRTGTTALGGDFLNDPELAPWREQALKRGFRSSIALPLTAQGRTFGALTLYASEPHAFNGAETTLLRELANDLAFGITAVRARMDRDRAQRELAKKADQLRALASQVTQVEHRERKRLAQLLHDNLQQLLVGARFSVEWIQKQELTSEVRKAAAGLDKVLREAVRSCRSLTYELFPPVLFEAGLSPALEWLSQSMQKTYGLTIKYRCVGQNLAPDEETSILIYQAVRELLFNVLKHAGVKSAEVRLELDQPHSVRVMVRDRGKGFSPVQVRASEGIEGGLGLFTIRERLNLLGGVLEVQSAPGRGSRFTLQIPTRPPASRPPPANAPAPIPAEPLAEPPRWPVTADLKAGVRRKLSVLLADDHAVVRDGLARLLQGLDDMEVVGEAANGYEAVDLVQKLEPQVVVMDVNMPRLNGIEATRRILAMCPDTKVIGLSMHEQIDYAQAMMDVGARAYLSKTEATEKLLATIRACFKDTPAGRRTHRGLAR